MLDSPRQNPGALPCIPASPPLGTPLVGLLQAPVDRPPRPWPAAVPCSRPAHLATTDSSIPDRDSYPGPDLAYTEMAMLQFYIMSANPPDSASPVRTRLTQHPPFP
ncbi:hypothetical protein BU16DRAFT_186591 [Lophium mytilinum]|uniref:Uncharacterized protein n=1 Tax=Lophium mytilinum TaxID=390894 RepID=A0A6A6RB41_9PEZI|nr:hypothetical protein BU16DRAFT_186591 [Lophium mytilinum]